MLLLHFRCAYKYDLTFQVLTVSLKHLFSICHLAWHTLTVFLRSPKKSSNRFVTCRPVDCLCLFLPAIPVTSMGSFCSRLLRCNNSYLFFVSILSSNLSHDPKPYSLFYPVCMFLALPLKTIYLPP